MGNRCVLSTLRIILSVQMALPQVFSVTRLFGLYPFNNAGRFCNVWAVVSFFILTINCTCIALGHMWFKIKFSHLFSSIEILIDDLITVFKTIIPVHHFCMMIILRKKAQFIHEFLQESKYTYSYTNIAVLYLSHFIFMMILAFVEFGFEMTSILSIIMYNLSHQMNFLIIGQFVAILNICNCEFRDLNHLDLLKHSELITRCRLVNRLYGSQMGLLTGFLFAELTSKAFELVVIFKSDLADYQVGSHAFVTRFIADSVFIVSCVIHVLLISRSCGASEMAANEFNVKLFQLIKNDEQLCRNRELFTYATLKPSTEFTASGFFKLGYPLVSAIISSVCSYLIILIQFRDLNQLVSTYLDPQLNRKSDVAQI